MEEKITEGWKKVRLGDCIKEIVDKTRENNQYEVLSVTKDGIFSQEEFFKKQIASENNIGYKIIRRNNLVFSTMNLWMGSLDVLTNYDIGIVSPAYKIFEFNTELMLPQYGNYFMKSYYMIEQYKKYSEQGASVVRRNLDLKGLLNSRVIIPSIEEQEEIVKIIEKTEKIIDGIHNKINYNKKLKQASISKIFKDNTNWKEETFQNIFSILQNNSFKRDYLNYENGKCKNIHYGDILTKYSEITNINESNVPYINTEIDINNYKEESFLKNGDIVIADTAEDEMVGKVTEIENVNIKVLSGLHTIACRPKKVFAKGYLGIYMNSKEYHNQLIPLMQGIKVLGINKSSIIKTKLKYPDIKKQENIVNVVRLYNKIIDNLIIQEEIYKKMKIALIQQLLTGKVRVKI